MSQKQMIFALMVGTICVLGGMLLFTQGLGDAGLMVTGMAILTLTLLSKRRVSTTRVKRLHRSTTHR